MPLHVYSVESSASRRPRVRAKGQAHCQFVPIDGTYTAVLPVCEPQARAWRSYVADPLPDRPNLEQLKKQAKSLLRAAQARDAAALARFAILPAFSRHVGRRRCDAAVARAARRAVGHRARAWIRVVERAARRGRGAHALVRRGRRRVRPLRDRRRVRPRERLLALHPGIASASLQTALVLGDAAAVEARLADHPELATRAGRTAGVGAAALRVSHVPAHGDPARGRPGRDRAAAAARSAPTRTPSTTGTGIRSCRARRCGRRVCAVGHLPLAEVLLEAGANPTDGVSGAHRRRRRQHRGARAAAPLRRQRRRHPWRRAAARLHDDVGHQSRRPALAARARRRSESRVGRRRRGAAPRRGAALGRGDGRTARAARRRSERRRADGRTPHTLAELHGNHDIATWLLAHGADDELSPLDRFVAACARGDRAAAAGDARGPAGAPRRARPEHHLHAASAGRERQRGRARDDARVRLRSERAATRTTSRRSTARRWAAIPEAVRVLLALGADVNALDGMFAATPLVWAVEGRGNAAQPAPITSASRAC